MATWKTKQSRRAGLPSMTKPMLHVMRFLTQSTKAGYPFVYLDETDPRTIRALVKRDWIFGSSGIDGTRYKITHRGEKALRVYERQGPQRDGLCPNCRANPKKVSKNGRVYGYCDECNRKHQNRQFALKGHQLDPYALCPCCKERPRHTYPSGFIIVYCKPCRDSKRADEKRRKQSRLLDHAQKGTLPPCIQCKSAPRRVLGNTVYDYCEACHRAYMKEYQRNYRVKQKGQLT